MKTKLYTLIGALFCFGLLRSYAQTQTTIYTPLNSPVRAYYEIDEMPYPVKLSLSDSISLNYPNATELNPPSATTSYNCHGYAWHVSQGGSNRWIGYYPGQEDDENEYWEDGSYIRVTNESDATKISYYADNHSAVQTSTQGIYVSKWGPWPLVQHARDYGPAGYQMNYRYYYAAPVISGPSQLDCSASFNYSVQDFHDVTYTWTTSSNLQINGSNSNRTVNVSQKEFGGSGWVRVSIYVSEWDVTHVETKSVQMVSPTAWLTSDHDTSCLNYERLFIAHISGGCTPYSYQWYVNYNEVGSNSSTLSYNFDEENWDINEGFIVFCVIYSGPNSIAIATDPIGGMVLYCDDPLSVSITGDEDAWVDDFGNWSANVSGGSGEYLYSWHIDDIHVGTESELEYFFDSGEWEPNQLVYVDLKVLDYITEDLEDAGTFYCYLWNSEYFSVQVSPNPATDYVNLTITKNEIPEIIKLKDEKSYNIGNEFFIISLIDARGNQVFQSKTSETRITIPVSGYLPGTYHLKISSSKVTIDKTIIISH